MTRFGWGSTPYTVVKTASDASAVTAPGEGKRLWVTDVVIGCGTDTTMALTDSDDNALFPACNEATASNLSAPIKVTENKGLKTVKVGANAAGIFIGYYIEDIAHG